MTFLLSLFLLFSFSPFFCRWAWASFTGPTALIAALLLAGRVSQCPPCFFPLEIRQRLQQYARSSSEKCAGGSRWALKPHASVQQGELASSSPPKSGSSSACSTLAAASSSAAPSLPPLASSLAPPSLPPSSGWASKQGPQQHQSLEPTHSRHRKRFSPVSMVKRHTSQNHSNGKGSLLGSSTATDKASVSIAG